MARKRGARIAIKQIFFKLSLTRQSLFSANAVRILFTVRLLQGICIERQNEMDLSLSCHRSRHMKYHVPSRDAPVRGKSRSSLLA